MKDYKGYTAKVEFDAEDEILNGRVIGLRDVIYFEGTSVDEIRASFHEAVDQYLSYCQSRGQQPDKPYPGNLSLRVGSDLHRKIAIRAESEQKSINAWIQEALTEALESKRGSVKSESNGHSRPTPGTSVNEFDPITGMVRMRTATPVLQITGD